MNNQNVEKIKLYILKNEKMIHFALNPLWYENNNLLHIKDLIFQETYFLDENASFRERIFYIEKNLNLPIICPYCNKNQVRLIIGGSLKFQKTCKNDGCLKLHKSKVSSKNWEKMDLEKKKNVHAKIGASNKGKTRSQECREQCRKRNLGLKQSSETKQKRVNSRKNNGNPWFSQETIEKLSKSNKVTHSSKEFQEKYKSVFFAARKKISISIKKRILAGDFTPSKKNKLSKKDAFCIKNEKIFTFRSSWEAIFSFIFPNLEYEKIRIPYSFKNEEKIYIVDFVDFANKRIYEIKPDSQKDDEKNISKFEAAKKWAEINEFKFEIITEKWFQDNLKEYKFDDQNNHLNLKLKGILKNG